MKQVTLPAYGGPEVLTMAEAPEPEPGPGELLVRVRAAGVNRADCLQRAGARIPCRPASATSRGSSSPGRSRATGAGVTSFASGDRVFALVAEGGYAEYALVDAGLAVPIPQNWSFAEGAAVIEVFCTANETVFELGGLREGQSILVHAGASGVGTAAVQMAKQAGATVHFTAGSRHEDRSRPRPRRRSRDPLQDGRLRGGGAAVHPAKASTWSRTSSAPTTSPATSRSSSRPGPCSSSGSWAARSPPSTSAGCCASGSSIRGFTLRAQSVENKRAIVGRFRERWLPLLAAGTIRPIIHATVPFEDVRRAHEMMEANENFGKIILAMD